jgi:hypothetical protein
MEPAGTMVIPTKTVNKLKVVSLASQADDPIERAKRMVLPTKIPDKPWAQLAVDGPLIRETEQASKFGHSS